MSSYAISSILWSLLEYLLDMNVEINQALVWSLKLTYMNLRQYGQANLWLLVSSSFWLDIPNTHFNLYLHTSRLIILMQSDFSNLYSYKQTNVENILYPLYIVFFVISPLLDISSLIHSWFLLQSLIKANPLSNSSCSCKATHYWD